VRTDDVASPLESVVTVQVVVGELLSHPEEANVALAPLLGAVKVTETPETGLLSASFTTATSRLEKAVCTAADCPDPDTVEMLLAAPEPSVTENDALVAVHERHTATTW
jgi:hypothetical protein